MNWMANGLAQLAKFELNFELILFHLYKPAKKSINGAADQVKLVVQLHRKD